MKQEMFDKAVELSERLDLAKEVLAGLETARSTPMALHQFVEVSVPTSWLPTLVKMAKAEVGSIEMEIEEL